MKTLRQGSVQALLFLLIPFAIYSQVVIAPNVYTIPSSPPAGYEFEVTRYLEALTGDSLLTAQETRLNTFVVMLKDTFALDSITQWWTNIYPFDNSTQEGSLFNLAKRLHDITLNNTGGTLSWSQYTGWVGTAADVDYMDANWIPLDDRAGIIDTHNVSVSIYTVEDGRSGDGFGDAGPVLGVYDATAGARFQIALRSEANTLTARITENNFINDTQDADTLGNFYTHTRDVDALGESFGYKNGVEIYNPVTVSEGFPDLELWLMNHNNNGATFYNSTHKTVGFIMIGKGLTASEQRSLYNIVNYYITNSP